MTRHTRQMGQDLSAYDGKRIGIILNCRGVAKVFCGQASYEMDDTLGRVLRVRVEDAGGESGDSVLFIAEKHWDGDIKSGGEYGCSACFVPSPTWPPA